MDHVSGGPGQSDNGGVSDDDRVVQSDMDRALLRVVMEALAPLPEGAATVRHEWVTGAGMWFVEVRPRLASAARFDIGFDNADLLNSQSATSGLRFLRRLWRIWVTRRSWRRPYSRDG
jgi:hypothetical protein